MEVAANHLSADSSWAAPAAVTVQSWAVDAISTTGGLAVPCVITHGNNVM